MKKQTRLRLPRWRPDSGLWRRLLPYAGILMALAACLAVGALALLPSWRGMQEQASAAGQARQELDARRATLDTMRHALESQLAAVTAANEAHAALLLSRQQVTEVLTRLYAEAEARGVAVVDLRGQPSVQPEAEGAAPYQVRNLRLRATGGLPALLGLVAQVQQAAPHGGLLLENLQAVPGKKDTDLVVDLVLFAETGAEAAGDPESTRTPEAAGPPGSAEPDPLSEGTFFVRPTDWPVEWSWPTGDSTPSLDTDRVHLVTRGDTLFSLAERYGVTVDALVAANGLFGDAIYVGQTLRIPG